MKMTIKEIKTKGEKDDKIKFTGKVKNVYDAKEAVTKYTVSRQNIIVEDETDNIKVIISHKIKESEYGQDVIGKEVEVDGKISIWEGQINIFGKLIFKAGEAPVSKTTAVAGKPKGTSAIPIVVEVRKASLKFALEFWTARIGDKMEETKIIKTADKFYLYLTGKADKVSGQKKEQKKEEPEESKEKAEIEKEEKEIAEEEKLSAEKVALINEIMTLKESQHIDEEVFKDYCDGCDIKTIKIESLEKIKKRLNEQASEVPF